MTLYRIARSEYINDLSGTGAKLYGGRWNEKGSPLLYTSEQTSLGILEILVHFDGLTVPHDLKLLFLELPESEIEDFSIEKFKNIQTMKDAEFQFKIAGQKWIKSQSSLAFRVPSIITEYEYNVMINPLHPNITQLKKVKVVDLQLDDRLFQ